VLTSFPRPLLETSLSQNFIISGCSAKVGATLEQ